MVCFILVLIDWSVERRQQYFESFSEHPLVTALTSSRYNVDDSNDDVDDDDSADDMIMIMVVMIILFMMILTIMLM